MSPEDPSPAREHPGVQAYARHVNPTLVKLLGVYGYGRAFVRARDVWVWDHTGRRYLDALACFGAANLGHNHPRIIARLKRHLDEEHLNFVHVGPSVHQGALAARLVEDTGPSLDVALFSNSGAEAVEGGLKLARAATGRSGLAYCAGGYHGTTLGTLSILGTARMRRPFEPLLGGCVELPFGDLGALKKALEAKRLAAFIVDPGLCEMGALEPPAGYLAEAQALCTRYGTVLVLDEVQVGLGRTGTLFAYQQEGFVPDVLCLAKSLSGAVAPIACTVTGSALHARAFGSLDRYDAHFSTFGGNAFSCAAAHETLEVLRDEGLPERSRALGAWLLGALRARLDGHPLVRAVRGRGLFLAVELGPTDKGWVSRLAPGVVEGVARTMFGQWAAVRLLERGVLCQPASQHWNVLKVVPPLTLQRAEAETLVDAFAEVLGEYQGVGAVLKDVTGRLGRQFRAGWSF
ncbi:MAG: aspartate aminotransferase family protein [Deltaproteobacteria bacterium]|nr:aspartate aminotransferase family protein [Deltaproteobacteria bacterium]